MNTPTLLLKTVFTCIVGAVLGLSLIGCDDTAEGAKQDTREAAGKSQGEPGDMTEKAKETAKDALVAGKLTPQIKSAIIANPMLNDPKNRIDVDSVEGVVYLRGYVTTLDLKILAGKIAQQVLDENNAKETLNNELEIRPSS